VGEDDGLIQPLAELDCDRRTGPAAAVEQALRLLAHELAELMSLELRMPVRCRQEAADGTGDGTDAGSRRGELPPRGDKPLE
jgi:hypothetical protein